MAIPDRMTRVLAVVVIVACNGRRAPSHRVTEDPPPAIFVDELVATDHEREVRVAGTIEGPFTTAGSGAERTISFDLVHRGKHLRVIHTGVLPIRFRERSEGAADGRWLRSDEAKSIVIARGLTDEGDIFDARDVLAYGPALP